VFGSLDAFCGFNILRACNSPETAHSRLPGLPGDSLVSPSFPIIMLWNFRVTLPINLSAHFNGIITLLVDDACCSFNLHL
jgi:hypothetical protein